MQAGDIVRFRRSGLLMHDFPEEAQVPWKIGLLVEYHTWEKIATILHDGEVLRVAARDVQLHTRGAHESG
tara:strand:- start:197 stop:406 length:210 start_codon:yes stop_codon:yes gene_type:complete